jgi:LacI family transcriptional regulator
MSRTTIDDVAELARVSIKTVSRVLNEEEGVRPETRQRVQEAMLSLNYQPSIHARSLAGRRSNLLGLVFDNPSGNYVFDVQSGAMARCNESRFRLFIEACTDLGDQLIGEILAMVEQTHIDGLVITPPLSANQELIAALDSRNVPFVRIAPDDTSHDSPAVLMDDRAAARQMTEYLLDLGHERVGFIAGHPDHHSSLLRIEGFREAHAARGRKVNEAYFEQGYNDVQSGTEAGRRLLARADRPTAVFASNDDMAAGLIIAAHESGIKVPDELSVCGFDDTQLARTIWPALTTIHQPTYDMAYAATGLLIDLLKGGSPPAVTWLQFTMQRRGSTARPEASSLQGK